MDGEDCSATEEKRGRIGEELAAPLMGDRERGGSLMDRPVRISLGSGPEARCEACLACATILCKPWELIIISYHHRYPYPPMPCLSLHCVT